MTVATRKANKRTTRKAKNHAIQKPKSRKRTRNDKWTGVAYSNWRKGQQLCTGCGNKSETGHTFCTSCLEKIKQNHLMQRYGISSDVYNGMLLDQGLRCVLCKKVHDSSNRQGKLRVDHDHVTNKIRGLLCSNCNSGLGFFQDNPELLLQAISYLKSAEETLFLTVVSVSWIDATSAPDQEDAHLMEVVTFGSLVDITKEHIKTANEVFENGEMREVSTIPIGMVSSIELISLLPVRKGRWPVFEWPYRYSDGRYKLIFRPLKLDSNETD